MLLRFLSKFLDILLILKNSNFNFDLIKVKNKKVIIFDRYSEKVLSSIFSKEDIFILDINSEGRKIKELYLNYKIIINLIIEIFNKNLKLCYYTALIKTINPKLVITSIDNDFNFYELSKVFKNKIKFIAVQSSYRDISGYSQKKIEQIYLDHYFCFGNQTVEHYKDMGANIQNYYLTGSITLALAENDYSDYIKKNSVEKFDIALISENPPLPTDPVKAERLKSLKKIAENVNSISIEKNFKVIILIKRDSRSSSGADEVNFYKEIFKNNKNVSFSDNTLDKYINYYHAFNSEVVVGSRSTLLLEVFSKEKKIVICNYKQNANLLKNGSKKFNRYAELNPLIDKKNFFSLNDDNYKDFKNKFLEIYHMNKKDFLNLAEDLNKYMLFYDKSDSIAQIKEKIGEICEK